MIDQIFSIKISIILKIKDDFTYYFWEKKIFFDNIIFLFI